MTDSDFLKNLGISDEDEKYDQDQLQGMNNYFGDDTSGGSISGSSSQDSDSILPISIKSIIALALIFLLVTSPFVKNFIKDLPHISDYSYAPKAIQTFLVVGLFVAYMFFT